MSWYSPFILPYLLSSTLTCSVAIYAFIRRQVPGARSLLLLAGLEYCYTIIFLLENISPLPDEKLLWDSVQWFFAFLIPLAGLALTLEITCTRRRRLYAWLLSIFPILFCLLLLTNSSEQLFYPDPVIIPAYPAGELFYSLTPLVQAAFFYIYAVGLIGIGVILWRIRTAGMQSVKRFQIVLIGLAVPFLISFLLTVSGIFLLDRRDASPLLFGISNLIVAYGIFHQRLFSVLPAAYDRAIESMPDAVLVLNIQREIIAMNAAARAMLPDPAMPYAGKPLAVVFPDWQPSLAQFDFATSYQADLIFADPQPDRSRVFDLRAEPIQDGDGGVAACVMIVRDVTQQHQILQKQRQLEQAVEQSTSSIMIATIDGNIRYVNSWFTHLTGYTREETYGKTASFLHSGLTPDTTYKAIDAALRAGESWRGEFINRKKDGTLFWEWASISPVRDETGTITHYVAVKEDVTEQIEMEKKLQSAQHELLLTKERLELALWGGEIGLWDIDFEKGSIYYNEQWATMVGYTLAEIEPRETAWERMIHPDDKPQADRLVAEHIANKTPYFQIIYRTRSKSGEWRYLIDRGRVIAATEDGRPLRAIGTRMDVSEIESIKRQLQQSEDLYRSIITAMHEGIIVRDQNGRIVTANSAAERILGLTRDQMHGLAPIDPAWRVVREDASVMADQDLPATITLRTGKPLRDVIMGIQKPDQTLTWILVNTQPLFHSDADQSYAVITSFSDITERRRAEESLRYSEARFSQAFHNSPVPMCISTIDVEHPIYLDANDAYQKMVGYSWDELKGQSISSMNIAVENQDREQRRTLLEEFQGYRMKEAVYRNRAGEIRNMIISSQRVQFDNQTCDIEIMLDITERKRAQDQALALSLERERVNFITQFIRSASHEFRTPLSVIATSTYLLTRASDPARFRSHAERIDGQVKRLIRLLDMLLLMAQLDSSSTIPMLPVVLNTLIDQAKTASFTEQTEKRLQVTTSYPSEVLQTKGDTAYLRQMLNLLMENAVRYTPEGGAISVSLSESAGQAVIEVRDTGSGISEEYMPLIFELLWRQDEAHTESGFGLGLPIVKRIVDLHRGSISISSKIDEGTAVIIHLPLVDAS